MKTADELISSEDIRDMLRRGLFGAAGRDIPATAAKSGVVDGVRLKVMHGDDDNSIVVFAMLHRTDTGWEGRELEMLATDKSRVVVEVPGMADRLGWTHNDAIAYAMHAIQNEGVTA